MSGFTHGFVVDQHLLVRVIIHEGEMDTILEKELHFFFTHIGRRYFFTRFERGLEHPARDQVFNFGAGKSIPFAGLDVLELNDDVRLAFPFNFQARTEISSGIHNKELLIQQAQQHANKTVLWLSHTQQARLWSKWKDYLNIVFSQIPMRRAVIGATGWSHLQAFARRPKDTLLYFALPLWPDAVIRALLMKRTHLLTWFFVWLLGVGCQQKAPSEIREMAGEDTAVAFYVPSLQKFLTNTEAFASRVMHKVGTGFMRSMRDSMVQQYGLDFLDPAAYKNFGIDANARVLFFAVPKAKNFLTAITLSDASQFNAAMKALAEKRDASAVVKETKVSGFRMATAGRSFGDDMVASFHWAHVGGFALIAANEDDSVLKAALERISQTAKKDTKEQKTLMTDPLYRELLSKVSGGDVVIFARSDANTVMESMAANLSKGAISALSLTAEGLHSETYLSLQLPGVDKLFSGESPSDLAKRVQSDAAAYLLSRAMRAESIAVLRSHPSLDTWVEQGINILSKEVGIDPNKDLLPLLSGPLTVSLHIANPEEGGGQDAKVSRLVQEVQQVKTPRGLLDILHVVLTAEVKDPVAMEALLVRSQGELSQKGTIIEKRELVLKDKKITAFGPASKEATVSKDKKGIKPGVEPSKVGWTVYDNIFVYAAGLGRLQQTLELFSGEGASLATVVSGTVGAELAKDQGATVAVLRTSALLGPPNANSNTPAMTGIAALIGGIVDIVRTIGDVGVSFSADEGGIRIKVAEKLQ